MKTPKDPRHQARRLAVALVYSIENTKDSNYSDLSPDFSLKSFTNSLKIMEYDRKLFNKIITTIRNNYSNIKGAVEKNSKDWELEKIYKTDLAVLITAIAELQVKTAPQKVIIDEAVELAKEFGEQESSKFVNGILSGVVNE